MQATIVKICIKVNVHFDIEISDNGNGKVIDKTDGNGLKNMKYRIKQLNGIFNIDFKPQQGTFITISVPL